MHVTGDRTGRTGWPRSATTTRVSRRSPGTSISDGVLVGYQLDRRIARLTGFGRSNGCAFADSPGHMPIQRMANVSLQPAPDGPSTEELIAGVDRGIYVVGDKSWSIDMQRYNFQFTGQRFYRIENGRLAGQLRDVAYQATTTDFWDSMEAVGGPQTYVLGGAFNCGKGQPGQVAPVSHGCPSALFRGVRILNTAEEGAGADQLRHGQTARTGRWAPAAGHRRAGAGPVPVRRLHRDRRRDLDRQPALGGQHAHHQRGRALPAADRDRDQSPRGRAPRSAWCRARACATTSSRTWSGRPSRPRPTAPPAEDAQPLVGPDDDAVRRIPGAAGWDDPVARPRSGCSAGSRRTSARRSTPRSARRRKLYGFAEHSLNCTFLGTSSRAAAAPRPAHRPGGAERQVRRTWPARRGPAARPGTSPTSTSPALDAGSTQRLDWAQRQDRPAAPAGTRRCCPRAPWPTC